MSNVLPVESLFQHRLVGVYRNLADSAWVHAVQEAALEQDVANIRDADKVRLHLFTDHEMAMIGRYPFASVADAEAVVATCTSDTALETIQTASNGLWVMPRSAGIIINLSAYKVFTAERDAVGERFHQLKGFNPRFDQRDIGLHIGRVAAGVEGKEALRVLRPLIPKAITLLPLKVKTVPR